MISLMSRKILKRVYEEEIKEDGNVDRNVNAGNLQADHEEFIKALQELEEEGLAEGVKYQTIDGRGRPNLVDLKNMRLTQKGIDVIEGN